MSQLQKKSRRAEDESWISVSDLMAGLMMVFLFIAVIYAKDADQRAQNVSEIVTEWQDSELEIYQALEKEFRDDLERWQASIQKETLTIRFASPEILFARGSDEITPEFALILDDFIPRYIKLLHSRFEDQIKEVRIEGHTSSEWLRESTETEAFIGNMELSQRRTRSVLQHALAVEGLDSDSEIPWMRATVSANGLSSARIILRDGIEDREKSRRVEFTIRTKTKEALFKILERISPAIERQI